MNRINKFPCLLVLQDGTYFYGNSIGKIGTTFGEICFNTGMTGYQEIFTDPSYFGQILLATNDHIGNYGISEIEVESDSIKIAGLVCKNFSYVFSRKQAKYSIHEYFTEQNLVGISDVDTRQIVRYIRNKGAMNAVISSEILDIQELTKLVQSVPDMHGLELSSKVTTDQVYHYGNPGATYKVAVLDLGVKRNILNCLADRDVYATVFPGRTSLKEMMAMNPDGFLISNGPGDPATMGYAVDTVKEILEINKPLFGICLGNQILGQACGLSTFKMHNGHRGLNHPVKNLVTGHCEITSQNHGFAINAENIDASKVQVTHLNLNDNTVEGIKVKDKNAFAVQYHPESSPGPNDSRYLFDDFVKMLK